MTRRSAPIGDAGYSTDELETMIHKMQGVTEWFYPMAQQTGCHTFIEFCGLMNEFIKVCQQSLAAGVDFATASTHSGKPLIVHEYNAAYLVEKLDCIFGPTITANKAVEAAFAKLTPGPIREAREWAEKTVQEIAEARVLTCVYCGHQYPKGTPEAKHAALTEHIQTCEKHPMTALREKVKVFCDHMAEALGAEPLAEEEHDLDVLAETLITRLKAGDQDAAELQKVMTAILAPFGKRYRVVAIADVGTKETIQGEAAVVAHMPGSTAFLAEETMRQHLEAYNALKAASAELLSSIVVHGDTAAGTPVDLAAKKLNELVKPK